LDELGGAELGDVGGAEALDFGVLVDGLRCRSTEWLESRRGWLVRKQRRLRVEELAVIRVLDERGRVDETLAAADGVSVRVVRESVATARALEHLPQVAAAAARGELSEAQLHQVTRLVDPGDPGADARWASEAPGWSPADLADAARRRRAPTVAESRARRAARELRWWWRRDAGMLEGRFSLADVDGAVFESVITGLVDAMRPAPGERWEPRERRAADALVALCEAYLSRDRGGEGSPTVGVTPHLIVQVPLEGPATVAGVPLPDAMVEALRAQARIEPVLIDRHGAPVTVGRAEPALSDKTRRVVRQRDGKCRWPGCDTRVGLQIHHLWPRCWGGTDHFSNLAAVCARHHRELVPHGELLLVGNPNRPDGLTLHHRDQLADPPERTTQPAAHPATRDTPTPDHHPAEARAGPSAT
jgi:hypothetical protein